MNKEQETTGRMIKELEEIAEREPFSYSDILDLFMIYKNFEQVKDICETCRKSGIRIRLFIEISKHVKLPHL